MPPIPAIPAVPEPGQTTLSFHGPRITLKKPGNVAKPVQKVPPKLNRQWLFGSAYETTLARQFQTARIANYDPDKSDPEGYALYRNSYSRELKLAAIEWATNTYIKGKKDGDSDVHISRYAAAKRLGITLTMLRNWTRNKARIASQKRASRRGRIVNTKGKEHEMEQVLFKEFQQARKQGKAVGC
jgi:hypothetical protein